MQREERINEITESLVMALTGWQQGIWTALPAYIVDYNPAAGTCSVQPTIMTKRTLPNGESQWEQLPKIQDVVVMFPSGGGFSLTFPITYGDECLLVLASRCIDGWWQSGQISQQIELRMHDLSDGFAVFGPRSQPRVITPPPSADTVQLRSDDGLTFIEMAGDGTINITAPSGLNVTGPMNVSGPTTIQGDVAVQGDTIFTGTVNANGLPIDETHFHGGVQVGGGNTGPVAG